MSQVISPMVNGWLETSFKFSQKIYSFLMSSDVVSRQECQLLLYPINERIFTSISYSLLVLHKTRRKNISEQQELASKLDRYRRGESKHYKIIHKVRDVKKHQQILRHISLLIVLSPKTVDICILNIKCFILDQNHQEIIRSKAKAVNRKKC